jgi:MFS family permease
VIVPPLSDAAPETPREWLPRWLSRDLACLFAARSLRSFAVGYLGIILPIYIVDLGYDAVHLGMLFSISGVTGGLLAVCIGVLSDRFGRKPFIIAIALMMAAGVVGLALATNFALMVAAAAFATIGFPGGVGGGGGWGPYYPAAQSLVAEHSDDKFRTTIFGVLSFVGVIAGALGSLTAALPSLLHHATGLSILAGFRLLLLLTAVIGVLMALVVIPYAKSAGKMYIMTEGRTPSAHP